MRANEPQTCTDCGSTEVDPCTVCKKPVCPSHRSGTGRLADGYQCNQRDCWHVGYRGRTKVLN